MMMFLIVIMMGNGESGTGYFSQMPLGSFHSSGTARTILGISFSIPGVPDRWQAAWATVNINYG